MKFVLIGQSPAVLAAARVIRSSAAEGEIVIISCDGKLPYDRGLLPRLISRRVKEKELFAEAEEFVRSSGVSLVVDREISRINFNRRRIFLSEKQNLDYDVLVMADAPQVRLPGLKGIRRSGVFHLARLESVKGLVRYLPFVETVVVEVRSLQGLEAALALREQGKDVLVTSDQDRLLAGELDEASGKVLAFLLEKIGIRSILNNAFEDLLG
ncbi:MAG: FAD-dependent oxidoreductase, partial [Candidatus Omnitrophica bacterium]|nr:FAD-dependent oxidoreductase [Candidatus Omnitrophota bacterium]